MKLTSNTQIPQNDPAPNITADNSNSIISNNDLDPNLPEDPTIEHSSDHNNLIDNIDDTDDNLDNRDTNSTF